MQRPPSEWTLDAESEVLLIRLNPLSSSDDSSSGSSTSSFEDYATSKPQSKLASFGQTASRRLSLEMPTVRRGSTRVSSTFRQPTSPPRSLSPKLRMSSLTQSLSSRTFLDVGHNAVRQLLVELSMRIASLDVRIPLANPAHSRSRSARAEDEQIMNWLTLFVGFVKHWLEVEGRLTAELCSHDGDSDEDASASLNERKCALEDCRNVIFSHLDRIDDIADKLFVTPMAKVYYDLRENIVTTNHLLQTFFRETRTFYQPILRQLSRSYLTHLERQMATEIGQTELGPAHLIILTRWMEKERAAEWRKHRLDHRKRSLVKKAEAWYLQSANNFNESSLRT